jgi:hypothetical protein
VKDLTFSGFRKLARALRGPQLSDISILHRAPGPIVDAIGGREIVCMPPSPPPKFHLQYFLGDDLVLHVYRSSLHSALERSVSDRMSLQAEATFPGIPRLVSHERDGDLIWLIEERLHGTSGMAPLSDDRLYKTANWLGNFARLAGPPLRTTTFWRSHHAESVRAAPAAVRHEVAEAWELIDDVAATPLHGDVQPKNLVFGPHGVGLVDWEGFWLHGLPGHDLMFLATMNAPNPPREVVPDMLAGRPNRWSEPLSATLEDVGYSRERIRPALLVMLSLWSLGETRRRRRQRIAKSPTPFLELLISAMR